MGIRGQMAEDRSQMTEDRNQKTDDRRLKSDDRNQRDLISEFGMGKSVFGMGTRRRPIGRDYGAARIRKSEKKISDCGFENLSYSEYSIYDLSLISFWSMDIIRSITDSISRYSSIINRHSSFLNHSLECQKSQREDSGCYQGNGGILQGAGNPGDQNAFSHAGEQNQCQAESQRVAEG